jgi:hypothetical protein
LVWPEKTLKFCKLVESENFYGVTPWIPLVGGKDRGGEWKRENRNGEEERTCKGIGRLGLKGWMGKNSGQESERGDEKGRVWRVFVSVCLVE